MRFNLYQTLTLAAVMAAKTLAVAFIEEEETFDLPQTFDERDDYDFAEAYNQDVDEEIDQDLAELDVEADCPHKSHAPGAPSGCGGCKQACPPSDYEEGVKAKTQAALWDTWGTHKLNGKNLGGCLQNYCKGPVPTGGAGGCGAPACSACAAKPPCGCDKKDDDKKKEGGCNHLCDKAKEIIQKAKTTKCMKASAKDRQIDELRRKIEDKNKEVVKSKDDAAKMIEDMRKDCNAKFQKDQFSTLSKDFTEMKGTMEKLLKSKKGEDAENSKLKECLASAQCEIKFLKEKIKKKEEEEEEEENCDKKKKCKKGCKKDCKDGDSKDGDKGFDDENDEGSDCPASTQLLRARARNALSKLHARE